MENILYEIKDKIANNETLDDIINLVFELNREESKKFYSYECIDILNLGIQKKRLDFVKWYLNNQEILNYYNSKINTEIKIQVEDKYILELKSTDKNIYHFYFNYPLLQATKVKDNNKIIKFLLKKGFNQYIMFKFGSLNIFFGDFILNNKEYLKLLYSNNSFWNNNNFYNNYILDKYEKQEKLDVNNPDLLKKNNVYQTVSLTPKQIKEIKEIKKDLLINLFMTARVDTIPTLLDRFNINDDLANLFIETNNFMVIEYLLNANLNSNKSFTSFNLKWYQSLYEKYSYLAKNNLIDCYTESNKYKTSIPYIIENTYIDTVKDFCKVYDIDYYNVIWAFHLYFTRFERFKLSEKFKLVEEDIYGSDIINFYKNYEIQNTKTNYQNRYIIAAFIISVVVTNSRLSETVNVIYPETDMSNKEYVNKYKYLKNKNLNDKYGFIDEIIDNDNTLFFDIINYSDNDNKINFYYNRLKNKKKINIYGIKNKIYNKFKDNKNITNCLKRLDYLLMDNIISVDFNELELINLLDNKNHTCEEIHKILIHKIGNIIDFNQEIEYNINNDLVFAKELDTSDDKLEKGTHAININGDYIVSFEKPKDKSYINLLRDITTDLHTKIYLKKNEYNGIKKYFDFI